MKFLCENCKAKYQIADDKVAGRTVRMKCRKCGHMIEVEASVTETSVATKMPQPEEGVRLGASTGVSAPKGAVQAAAMGLPPPRPPAAPPRAGMSGGAGAQGAPVAPPTRPSAPKPAPRPAPGGPTASAGLAGAFSKAVVLPQDDPSSVSAAMAVLSSNVNTEEWYVGINGVPVGPVRLSELRRKAAAGLINDESLVWREGFEEWVPLRTFPELSAMLRETGGSARTSLTPTPPPGGNALASLLPAAPPTGRSNGSLAPAARNAAQRSGLATGRSNNVVAIGSRRATAEKIDGLGELEEDIRFESEAPPPAVPAGGVERASAAGVAAPSASVPPPSVVVADAALNASAAALGASALGASAPGGASVSTSAASLASDAPRLSSGGLRGRSRRVHPAAWIVVGLGGMLLGVVVMVFVLPKPDKPSVQIVSVMVPTPPPSAAPASSGEGDGVTTIEAIQVGAPTGGTKAPAAGTKTTGKTAEPVATGPAAPVNPSLSGLGSGLGGLVTGPSGPSGGAPTGGGGQPLAAADVERVVQSHRAFVKRQCWETALAGRAPNAPSSARVVANMTVAGDGHVSSSSATGGDAFPGLAVCVQNQVKGWKFPPSDGSTPVSVPFVFAAQ